MLCIQRYVRRAGMPCTAQASKPIKDIRETFAVARRKAAIVDFRFHDLGHAAVTNMRRPHIDRLPIMNISGHKTLEVFWRIVPLVGAI
jgi:hypothetical protein